MISVAFCWLEGADQSLGLPQYETKGSAGADLRANFNDDMRREGIALAAGARALVPTGLSLAIPEGFEAQIRPRSGLALKHGITLANSPGTIDADYRGPLSVILINHGQDMFQINHGDRIAQILFAPVIQAQMTLVSSLDETERGQGGFGSTGKS